MQLASRVTSGNHNTVRTREFCWTASPRRRQNGRMEWLLAVLIAIFSGLLPGAAPAGPGGDEGVTIPLDAARSR